MPALLMTAESQRCNHECTLPLAALTALCKLIICNTNFSRKFAVAGLNAEVFFRLWTLQFLLKQTKGPSNAWSHPCLALLLLASISPGKVIRLHLSYSCFGKENNKSLQRIPEQLQKRKCLFILAAVCIADHTAPGWWMES